jgi:tripartite-type tricarboxylate transporter receptor subunit TctC
MRLKFLAALFVAGMISLSGRPARGQDGAADYPTRPITLICPWGVGGGTDTISRQIAIHLETELGVPVNVVNATGGKGVTGHSRGLRAAPDGYTITMITLELNMLHWCGQAEFTWQDFTPLISLNEDPAALFCRASAPWQSLAELIAAAQAAPGKLTCSGTANGGAWHVALAGWLRSIGLPMDAITWVPSEGAGPSLTELSQGGLDLVCCSLPEARTLLRAGQLRCLGVMAPSRQAAFPDVPTFAELGSNWTLTGWRGLAVPKRTPPEIVNKLVTTLQKIVTGQTQVAGKTFPEFMDSQGYDRTWRKADALRAFLAANDQQFAELLSGTPLGAVSGDRFGPMVFPWILFVTLGLVLLALLIQTLCTEKSDPDTSPDSQTSLNLFRFMLVLGGVVAYHYAAPTAGFVLTASVLLWVLLRAFGTRWKMGLLVTLLFVPAVYQFFVRVLRVELPRGWLGW